MTPEWGSAEWRQAAEHWGHEQLRALGRRPVGEMVDDSIQAWSAVWRIPTDAGAVLIKQTTLARAREGEVTRFCAQAAPEQVTDPLAVDPTTARMLLSDGGTTLYSADHEHRGLELDNVTSIVADYAGMQRAVASTLQQPECLPCWDPSRAGDDARDQADFLHSLPDSDPRHISDQQHASIVGAQAELNAMGASLAASPIPLAVDQGDLWPGNILPPGGSGSHRFIDFGDAAWTHPFLSMRMLILECQYRWSVAEIDDAFNLDHPILHSVIDEYLRSWREFADLARLRTTLYDALRLAPLRRSRAWITNLDDADDAEIAELGYLPWSWLSDVTVPLHIGEQ